MPSGIQAMGLLAPIVASNAVFSARRASRGVDSISENPVYGAMNMDIAAAQVTKGAKAAKEIAAVSNKDAFQVAEGASQAIKNLSKESKILNCVGKVIGFTADNINPLICVTSGVKVLCSDDDKWDAGAREGFGLGTMFLTERAAKSFFGMPISKKVNGKTVAQAREAIYHNNPFLKAQTAAFKDFCATKKMFNKIPLTFLPGAAKGMAFVGASIAGYKLGNMLADAILGKKETVAA